MEITRTGSTIHLSMEVDEADAVSDDLGGIRASEISAAGDELHSLLAELPAEEARHVA